MINGRASRIRTYEITGSEPVALPLGYSPKCHQYYTPTSHYFLVLIIFFNREE